MIISVCQELSFSQALKRCITEVATIVCNPDGSLTMYIISSDRVCALGMHWVLTLLACGSYY